MYQTLLGGFRGPNAGSRLLPGQTLGGHAPYHDYANHHARARVLLLSATPYKMYTLSHEREEDDHYEDFLRTIHFLDAGASRQTGLGPLLDAYRRELYRLGDGSGDRLLEIRETIEYSLRRVMARTERVGATASADAMLTEIPMGPALYSQEM